jgi:hypothetical protein
MKFIRNFFVIFTFVEVMFGLIARGKVEFVIAGVSLITALCIHAYMSFSKS